MSPLVVPTPTLYRFCSYICSNYSFTEEKKKKKKEQQQQKWNNGLKLYGSCAIFFALTLVSVFVLKLCILRATASKYRESHDSSENSDFLLLCQKTLLDSLRRTASARNVSFRVSLRRLIHIINSDDKTKLSCNTPTDAAPQFL